MRSLLLVALGTAVSLHAQQTFVVDRDARQGTDFTDLPAAVAAAAPGDTLLVRTASVPYSAFATGKGLRLLGEGNTEINSFRFNPAVTVTGLPAGESFLMHGFRVPLEQAFEVVLHADLGRVVLSHLRAIEPCNCGPGVVLPAGIDIVDCADVAIDACENYGKPAIACVRSKVTITGCTLGILTGGIGLGDCLSVDGGNVEVVESRLDGSWAMDINGVPQPAVRLLGGVLRFGATSTSFVQGSVLGGTGNLQPAIDGSGGLLELDPDLRLNPLRGGALGLALHGALLQLRQYGFTFAPARQSGAPLQLILATGALAPSVLLLGLPTAPIATPFGSFLLDPSASIVLAAAVPATGVLAVTLPVPPGLPRGLVLCAQGVADLGLGVEASSPARFVLD